MAAIKQGISGKEKTRPDWGRIQISGVRAITGALSALFLLLVAAAGIAGGGNPTGPAPAAGEPSGGRIISIAPSITEIIFELGAGEQLAGVSKFCRYPPQALSLPRVGGLLDPSREAILRLAPDLVIVLEENIRFRDELAEEGFRVLAVDHKNIPGIVDSIEAIGKACGREKEGRLLADELRGRLSRMEIEHSLLPGRKPPRVLISVGRNAGNGSLGGITIAGSDGYYDEMIRLAGGVNAYQGSLRYPAISTEGLLRMNPDVIIDLVPAFLGPEVDTAALLAEWSEAEGTRAWDQGRIFVRTEDYWTVPGPRFIKVIESLSEIIDPWHARPGHD